MNYDVVGDIHGCAEELAALLHQLGYRERGGAYRQAGRTAVFVGDFIDTGRGQLETLRIVRPMIDCGAAVAVMGNHELNAIAWMLPDGAGGFLRSHDEDHRKQHEAFLAAVEGRPAHGEWVRWFLTLPLWLDLPELRVVHACWHPDHLAFLAPRLLPSNRLSEELMGPATRKPPRDAPAGSPERAWYDAIENVNKGVEVRLPPGHSFPDAKGKRRTEARVRWWDEDATTYRQAGIVPRHAHSSLPELPIPDYTPLGYAGTRPVFVGHYKLEDAPAPCAPLVACLDYNYGAQPLLCAYSYDGEPALTPARYTWVNAPHAD